MHTAAAVDFYCNCGTPEPVVSSLVCMISKATFETPLQDHIAVFDPQEMFVKGVLKAIMMCAYLYTNIGLRFGQVPQVVCRCKDLKLQSIRAMSRLG
jgi:hypothetical protein